MRPAAHDVATVRHEASLAALAEALRAQWRMIAAVSLRPRREGDGFDADIRLDPVVAKGSREQQGYPSTPDAFARAEKRRHDAIAECVDAVNADLAPAATIRNFRVIG